MSRWNGARISSHCESGQLERIDYELDIGLLGQYRVAASHEERVPDF